MVKNYNERLKIFTQYIINTVEAVSSNDKYNISTYNSSLQFAKSQIWASIFGFGGVGKEPLQIFFIALIFRVIVCIFIGADTLFDILWDSVIVSARLFIVWYVVNLCYNIYRFEIIKFGYATINNVDLYLQDKFKK